MVYKYYPPSKYAVDFFTNYMVRFTQPGNLNDPEDCMPLFDIQDINTYVNNIAVRNYHRMIGLTVTQIAAAKQNMITQFSRNPSGIIDKAIDIYYKNINSTIGILSLAKSPLIKLLWSYYCDSYKGFVIEFDEGHEFFNRRKNDRLDCGRLMDVNYVNIRPTIYLDQFNVDPKVFTSKMDDWKHEQEVRIIRELKNRDLENPPDVYLFKVPKDCIKKVIFGMKTDDKVKMDIIKRITGDAEMRHVTFAKVIITNQGKLDLSNI